ncbi:MAG: ABC transporter substrate binding protein [Mariprofundaceae bacterium]
MHILIIFISFFMLPYLTQAKECVYINSYHHGYAWSDKIENSIQKQLKGQCRLHVFRLDTKRHKSTAYAEKKALEAKAFIDSIHPDIILASDDNASKYLIAPYFKNSHIPVVFCGINWTAKPYGYPYRNATGMIEVSPIKAILKQAQSLNPIKKVAFIATKGVRTDEKEYAWMSRIYKRQGVQVSPFYVDSMQAWQSAYLQAQQYDLIVLNNIAGISDWDKQQAIDYITKHTQKLTVTTYDFMMPYTILGMTKIAEEQGRWAADVATHVLQGRSPGDIPVVANRLHNLYINQTILTASTIKLPYSLHFKAIKIQ